ncbi:hypothetical protein [Leptospira ilyithenensis]|uniref:Uncharacterized protein n=1 Tax=Leptospira ilyithenensis TaxID=2484901 RepID=A0A4R9LJA3_9LEPT|nr:hypothetical protein [Leptospira ilyithenensis]TGN06956.1 hypothetical protein EHS11_17655 [Leptospira ilyithenensis]
MNLKHENPFLEKIKTGEPIVLTEYGPSTLFDEKLLLLLDNLTSFYKISDFSSIFFTIIKDLILNGFKANFKRIFFLENRLEIESGADYELGVRMYKSFILSGKSETYEKLAREKNYFVETRIEHSPDFIEVTVTNNNRLVKGEMQKIKTSLTYAQNYNDIMEYYIERGDNSEGEGIGIALCVILLKGEKLPVENFKIMSTDKATIAKVKIPLKKN